MPRFVPKKSSFPFTPLPFTCLLLCFGFSFLAVPQQQASAWQTKKVRVFIFAGQSNCNGAGSRVGRYRANPQDWKSPYVCKMIQNVQAKDNDPVADSNWQKSTYYIPEDLDNDGDLDYEVGTRLSHMRWPFHTIYHEDNIDRLWHNYANEFDLAVHPPADGSPPYPGAFNDNHYANNGFDGFIGAETHFARIMRSVYPNDDVAIVKVSAGSSSMNNWEPARHLWDDPNDNLTDYQARVIASRDGVDCYPSGDPDDPCDPNDPEEENTSTYLLFYQHLVPAVKYSLRSLEMDPRYGPGNVELSGFVWIQGESDLRHLRPIYQNGNIINQSDIDENAADYKESFKKMVDVLRFKHNSNMPFVICRTKGFLNKDWVGGIKSERLINLQTVQQQLGSQVSLQPGGWINTDDLTVISEIDEVPGPNDKVDDVHLDSQSLRVVGGRVFYKFEQIAGPGGQ